MCKFIFRSNSIYVTRLFLFTPITANQVTALMFLAGIITGTLFLFGVQIYTIIGIFSLYLMFLLDSVDGEVARARGVSSLRGVYLDRLTHIVSYPYIFAAIGVGVYSGTDDLRALLLGFLAAIFWSVLLQTGMTRKEILYQSEKDRKKSSTPNAAASRSRPGQGRLLIVIKRLLVIDPTGGDMILIALPLGALFDQMYLVIIWFGVLLPLRWLYQVTMDFRNYF